MLTPKKSFKVKICLPVLTNFHQVTFFQFKVGVCDMMILDWEPLECIHDPPLHRDRLHCVSVHILSVAVLGSDTMKLHFATRFRSVPRIDTRRKNKYNKNVASSSLTT